MGKSKYTFELKLEIVKKYMEEYMSLNEISREYLVNRGNIQKWVAAYREYGKDGLININQTYTGKFRVEVVEYMHNTGASARKTAALFKINSYNTVAKWKKIYEERGPSALYEEHRGEAPAMGKKKKKQQKPRKQAESSEEKALREEVEHLRMENDYLKKLNALVQEREKSDKKTR